jgi:phosphoglycerate dehydrogenase-like enzyme
VPARKTRPQLVVLSGAALFRSFFDAPRQRRLSELFRWTRSGATSVASLRPLLAEADALVTTWDSPPLGADLAELAPRLRLIAHCGGEVKARFALPLFERLAVTNASAPMAGYVAELAVTFLLYAARNVDEYRAALRVPSNEIYAQVRQNGDGLRTIRDREVGILGLGQVGREIARLLRPFGARLLVHDPHVPAAETRRHGGTPVPFARLLRCPFLIVAAALNQETWGLLDARALARLRDGTTVVNVARGGIVDLFALTSEVTSGRLQCALDVTDPHEPLPIHHPLRTARGALLTPHVASASVVVRRQMADVVLANLLAFARGRRPPNRVTRAMLSKMT